MSIITPPAPFPLRGAKWRAPFPMQVNRSGWTGTSKKVGLPGATVWTLSGTFVTIISEAKVKPWRGFFMELCGQANSFRVRATETKQTTAANPTVRTTGANAGNTIPLQGLPVSTTVLLRGDAITVLLPSGHERLVILTADLVTNSSGQATATFQPELGEIPASGTTVEIQWPWCLMSLTSDPPGWDVDVGQTYTFPFSCEEAR